ncbi:MAG: phosphoribosylanthranilate isomerase [Opitutae bacterium]|nr:phosphoribosylanthranilate isomerase [Opitutae bacterium]
MDSVSIKVCGITRLKDARLALELGAEKLGFILHAKSPRKIEFDEIRRFQTELALETKQMVAVEVAPEIEDVREMLDQGFGNFQFHFPYDLSRKLIGKWAEMVDTENLWLAPRLPAGVDFPEDLLCFANTFLMDAYSEDKFGGTGVCSDWEKFSALQKSFSTKKWILAGGLSPTNIQAAIKSTDARIVDVNSGVEQSPGVKDSQKLKRFFSKIQ